MEGEGEEEEEEVEEEVEVEVEEGQEGAGERRLYPSPSTHLPVNR